MHFFKKAIFCQKKKKCRIKFIFKIDCFGKFRNDLTADGYVYFAIFWLYFTVNPFFIANLLHTVTNAICCRVAKLQFTKNDNR